jgi:hypothetical protein
MPAVQGRGFFDSLKEENGRIWQFQDKTDDSGSKLVNQMGANT